MNGVRNPENRKPMTDIRRKSPTLAISGGRYGLSIGSRPKNTRRTINGMRSTGAVAGEQTRSLRHDLVHAQLQRVLASAFFRNSDRSTRLLKHVVETALYGHNALLNQRSIGVNVFCRSNGYNADKDNVVRTAAVDMRSRLERYYALPEHQGQLRIILSPGSYVPQFARPDGEEQSHVRRDGQSARDKFWSPLIECSEPILIIVGPSQTRTNRKRRFLQPNLVTAIENCKLSEQISVADALTLSRIISYLESRRKEYRVEVEHFVRHRDLRNGPAILLGGLNNQWTISFAEYLRFALKTNPTCIRTWIRDAEDPSAQAWSQNGSQSAITEDYAIIARVLKSVTGQPIVIAGGHTSYGTAAAGEFMTNSSRLDSLLAENAFDWVSMNLEIIIATTVACGLRGAPRVSASCFWQGTSYSCV